MRSIIMSAALTLVLSAGLLAPAEATQYRTRFIDPPSGMRIQYGFCGINDSGQVIFSATDSANWNHGYVSSPDGALTEIGFLDGRNYANPAHINNGGQVVGGAVSWFPLSNAPPKGFSWTQADGIRELQARTPGSESGAKSINAAGMSVGYTTSPSAQVLACSWDAVGNITYLPSLGGTYGVATDVNDSGQIVGFSVTSSQEQVAAMWNPDGTIRKLGALPGYADSRAFAINSKGQAVGYSSFGAAGDRPITLWNPDGSVIRLSGLGDAYDGCADINDLGQAVGWWVDRSHLSHSIFYSQSTGVIELSVSGVRGLVPYQINNLGAISCFGLDLESGRSRFIVLEPVPEPSAAISLALGLFAMLLRRRRPD